MSGYAVPIYLPRRRRIVSPVEWLREKIEEQRRERESTIAAAVAIVQSAQTAGGANSAVGMLGVGATAGNTIVSFFSQSLATTPTCASGFTVNATKGIYNASADSIWVAYKIATGGETTATWSPGAGGTAHGVCIWELSGLASSNTLDGSPAHTDNLGIVATGTLTTTTTVPGSIVLIGVGANAGSGTISNWSSPIAGTIATNIGTTTARCFGGSYISSTPITGADFQANWATSHVCAMLGIAFQPPAATGVPDVVMAPLRNY